MQLYFDTSFFRAVSNLGLHILSLTIYLFEPPREQKMIKKFEYTGWFEMKWGKVCKLRNVWFEYSRWWGRSIAGREELWYANKWCIKIIRCLDMPVRSEDNISQNILYYIVCFYTQCSQFLVTTHLFIF